MILIFEFIEMLFAGSGETKLLTLNRSNEVTSDFREGCVSIKVERSLEFAESCKFSKRDYFDSIFELQKFIAPVVDYQTAFEL